LWGTIITVNMRKKRKIEDIPNPSEAELLSRMELMPEPHRSYAAFLYLYGSRVSEALGIPKREVVGHYEGRINGHTYLLPKYRVVRSKPQEYESKPLAAWNVDTDTNKEWVVIHNIPTFKRKNRPPRTAYVFRHGKNEQAFVDLFLQYWRTKDAKEPLWTHTRQAAYWACMKYLEIPPHKLRGLRATKDAVVYDLGAIDLKAKYHWASDTMPMHYARKNQSDIMKKIKKSMREE
jgi:hypothetical protein